MASVWPSAGVGVFGVLSLVGAFVVDSAGQKLFQAWCSGFILCVAYSMFLRWVYSDGEQGRSV